MAKPLARALRRLSLHTTQRPWRQDLKVGSTRIQRFEYGNSQLCSRHPPVLCPRGRIPSYHTFVRPMVELVTPPRWSVASCRTSRFERRQPLFSFDLCPSPLTKCHIFSLWLG